MRGLPVAPICRNRAALLVAPNQWHVASSRAHKRGASRSSRVSGAGCDGRWWCTRRTRRRVGEVAWSWHPKVGVKLASDDLRATEATKPGLRGEREISCKTIAQGMFWRKNPLNINVVWVLCRRLCRDPQKLLLSCEKLQRRPRMRSQPRPASALRPGAWQRDVWFARCAVEPLTRKRMGSSTGRGCRRSTERAIASSLSTKA